MILIDGKKEAAELREALKKEVSELKEKFNKVPGLTVILIGEMAPSQIYVRNKEKSANEVGLKSEVIKYAEAIEEKIVLDKIKELNNDENVSGILVQLPLPKHIDKKKVIEAILPSKDVDGFHPMNVGNLSSGYESSVPCTPLGCYLLIKKIEPNLSGKKAVMIGRSNLNGKPMTQLLLKENCTVTITHSKTKDLKAECLEADIIIAAVGITELVKTIHNYPENRNFYLPNTNKNVIAYLNGDNEIEYNDYNEMCEKILQDNMERLDELMTELETALQRNTMRAEKGERELPKNIVTKSWKATRKNMGGLKALFGKNFALVHNDKHLDDDEARHKFANLTKSYANKWVGGKIENPKAKQWIKDQLRLKKAGLKK